MTDSPADGLRRRVTGSAAGLIGLWLHAREGREIGKVDGRSSKVAVTPTPSTTSAQARYPKLAGVAAHVILDLEGTLIKPSLHASYQAGYEKREPEECLRRTSTRVRHRCCIRADTSADVQPNGGRIHDQHSCWASKYCPSAVLVRCTVVYVVSVKITKWPG